jgi:hypothetical protein
MDQRVYKEAPLPVLDFLTHPYYFGPVTRNGMDIFPVWKEAMTEMFSNDTKVTIVLTGSIGTGKSTIALYALCYIQYRLMILKEPWKYFELAESNKMTISFFNLNKTLGDSRGYGKMQSFLCRSPWFCEKASHIAHNIHGTELEFDLIKYVLASPNSRGFGIIGEDIVAGILDEVDSPIDSPKQKEKVLETYNATSLRFKNRFASKGRSVGKLFIVSSKQDELSFIETFIAERKRYPEVLIFDIPLWKAKPQHLFCGKNFLVAVGDAFNPPKLIQEDQREEYGKNGYHVIEVPVEFHTEFKTDLIRSLRDIAGITTSGMRRLKLFPSEKFVIECFDSTKEDPVKVPTIDIGLQDDVKLMWFFDLAKLRLGKDTPRFIHMDIAFSGDACGLAMSGVKEWKQVMVEKPDGTYLKEFSPIIETDFVMRIKAKEGDRIPIHKIREFIFDLRAAGVHIQRFTADLPLASQDTLQLLQREGIEAENFSVDKTNQPYFDFRNLVYEKRWTSHRHNMLLFELKHLEQDPQDGKVDHPIKVADIEFLDEGGIREVVMMGSKDCSDAVVGSVAQCLYSVKRPMDFDLMGKLIKKTGKTIRALTPAEDVANTVSNLAKTADGEAIVGIKRRDSIDTVNEIFKRIHNRP